ncbi:nonsense-mediated mRNA decay factor SMG5 isoform X2 [Plutella xylostella]|uniref:nonsense-mediated mRNA decay factor SMG5 isoform X2 n=1 Tax=Plutella xylostella TaxID=51655 RepID=UPI002032C56E|nr:nonsense-mediated mRNA decay factor SMG5 isoform X2 [Plutella xylostella]
MNGFSENTEAEIAERNERAKKLYRYITDVARRIDEATAACHSVADLFTTYIEVQRQKLRDNCEKLMFLDPLNYGKKSLELLWRKVYYDTVSAAKKFGEAENEYDNYLFTHIVCGIGHFHHCISRIQSEMKVECCELDYTPQHIDEEKEDAEKPSHDEELQLFGRGLLHSCLLYLGDLSRYQAEIFHAFDSSIAARYYLQSALVDMSSGMPYNQLGNLYLDKNHNLDSVCYYIQCLSCTVPFEGALGNLTKLFEKNTQFVETITSTESLSQVEHIQTTISNFLSLIEVWYLAKDESDIPQKCSSIAQLLKISMDFNQIPLPDINKQYTEYQQAVEDETLNPSYLNSNLIHKIVQVCLFTAAKMNDADEKKAFAAKAFTLALLSQLLQKLLQQLEALGFQNPADKYNKRSARMIESLSNKVEKQEKSTTDDESNEVGPIENNIKVIVSEPNETEETSIVTQPDIDATKDGQNGDAKTNKKTLAKRRRRRRLASSDSSDMTESEASEAESDASCSDEALSGSSFDSDDDMKSDNSDDITDTETAVPSEKQNGNTTNIHEKHVNGDVKENGKIKKDDMSCDSDTKPQLKAKGIQDFLRGDNFLPSIKLLQDWILNEKDLLLSCGDSGESLFQCVVDLLNIFTHYFKPKAGSKPVESCEILDYARSIAKKLKLDYRTIPLPEDVSLRGSNICKYDKDAAEWQLLNMYQPSVYEENIIRILKFIDFGDQIAKIVPRIRYNRSMQILYLKKTPTAKVNTKNNVKKGREWHNSKKQQSSESESGLLRRLGRLWLTSQVRELERSGRAAPPTMLVPTAEALHTRLKQVKLLLRARAFILLVPSVVLQELDELKRDQSSARDAIRWLEGALAGGARGVRAQRPGQARALPLLKYPRKAPPHIHNYIQILEFCHHFVADDRGAGDPKTSSLLVLLTADPPDDSYKEFSITGAAQSAGVTLDTIDNFYAKWRQTVHKSGKKR